MSSSERRGKRAEREERRGKRAERAERRETGGERREKRKERREKREERREKRKRSSFEQQQLTDRVCERPWARDGETQGRVDWKLNGWPDAKN